MTVSKIFGENLRKLCAQRGTIAGAARDLGINKVQFHRYLNGQSFPKPQVLSDICTYFDVDARILLQPLEDLCKSAAGDMPGSTAVPGTAFPSGFYRRTQVSARFNDTVGRSLCLVKRTGRSMKIATGLPRAMQRRLTGKTTGGYLRREGQVLMDGQGMYSLSQQPVTGALIFEFWAPLRNAVSPVWAGMTIYAVGETQDTRRASRFLLEPLTPGCGPALQEARRGGYWPSDNLAEYERMLLRPDQAFS